MNYIKHYIKLCKKAKNRILSEYTEKHHVFPQCIYGKNSYIVKLTAKEHFIAHFLLFKECKKRYGLNHWKTHKLGYAFYMMTKKDNYQERYYSRSYEIAKKWYSENNPSKYRDVSGNKNPMYGKTGDQHPLFGKPCSEERKRKISQANKGKLLGDKNPAKTKEARQKISDSWKNREPLTRNKNPRSKLTENDVNKILELYDQEKITGMSGFKFCRTYNEMFKVSPAAIGNIIYGNYKKF